MAHSDSCCRVASNEKWVMAVCVFFVNSANQTEKTKLLFRGMSPVPCGCSPSILFHLSEGRSTLTISTVFQASFWPAPASRCFSGPAGICNPSSESWAYPWDFTQLHMPGILLRVGRGSVLEASCLDAPALCLLGFHASSAGSYWVLKCHIHVILTLKIQSHFQHLLLLHDHVLSPVKWWKILSNVFQQPKNICGNESRNMTIT